MSSPTPVPRANAQAGPSRPTFFPPPFRLIERDPQPDYADSYARHHRAASVSSRSSTPVLFPNGARFRSASVFSVAQKAEDDHRKQRRESVLRLRSTWDLLHEKYGNIAPEDDDEIDLRTGEVVKDRGRLRDLVPRDFGGISESEDDGDGEGEGSSAVGGPEMTDFEADEDELGAWDERSGLDLQVANSEDYEEPPAPRWTEEDAEDLREFMRAEERRRRMMGSTADLEEGDEGEEGDDEEVERLGRAMHRQIPDSAAPAVKHPAQSRQRSRSRSRFASETNDGISPRHRGTRILPASLEDLFLSDGEESVSSEDELQVIADDLNNESTRRTPVASEYPHSWRAGSEFSAHRSKKAIEVVIPKRARSVMQPSSPPRSYNTSPSRPFLRDLTHAALPRPISEPSLANLFDSPPALPTTPSSQFRPPSPLGLSSSASASRPSSSVSLPPLRISSKGKGRMLGERPVETVGHHSSSLPIRTDRPRTYKNTEICAVCIAAGGERARKATSCRKKEGKCPFERVNDAVETSGGSLQSRLPLPPSIPPNRIKQSKQSSHLVSSNNPNAFRISHRSCRKCREAGGQRALNSMTCKGKMSWRMCPFERRESSSASLASGSEFEAEPESSLSLSDDLESISSDDERIQKFRTLKLKSKVKATSAGPATAPSARTSTTRGGQADDENEHSEPLRSHFSLTSSERKSRRQQRMVLSDSDDLNSISESENLAPSLPPEPPVPSIPAGSAVPATPATPSVSRSAVTPRTARGRSQSVPAAIAAAEAAAAMTTPVRPANLNASIYLEGFTWSVNGAARSCRHCRNAGGMRAKRAFWCKGRSWGKYCVFLNGDAEQVVEQLEPAEDQELQSSPNETRSTAASALNIHTPEAMSRSSSVNRSKRKRVLQSPPDYSSSPRELHHTAPPSPPASSLPPSSPPTRHTPNTSRSTIRPSLSRHTPSLSSLPPSSPPIPATETGQTRRTAHPTPSPSVSISATLDSSPLIGTYGDRPIAPLPFRPTPSPSIGPRSSSISSDHVLLALPRKSALRQPSTSTGPRSSSSSVKRTRFSLQPRSPIRDISSDSYAHEYSEPSYVDTSSPLASSPMYARYASSSSPLRNEWTVRAHDVGFKLGPEHTGRVPQGMLKALAPSLSTYRPTLGSSLYRSSATASTVSSTATGGDVDGEQRTGYALPTPPPSSGSTSVPNKTGNAGSRPAVKGGTPSSGLMLPPPVPPRRDSSVRPPTPVSLTDEPQAQPRLASATATPSATETEPSRKDLDPASAPTSRPSPRNADRSSTPTASAAFARPITPSSSPSTPPGSGIKFTSRPASYERMRSMRALSLSASGSDRRSRSRSLSVASGAGAQKRPNRLSAPSVTPSKNINKTRQREEEEAVSTLSLSARRKSRIERELARVARAMPDDAGLEWGLDEEADDGGRMWREGSVVTLLTR